MKKLTKIKLVNWHLFSNQTIEINGNALISGENGSGKSTLLDALQYLLVGGRANAKFNIAATDDAKRSLDGYIRGRIGAENKEFIRAGDVITHIALEFYDEQAKEYSIVGAVLDLPRQGSLKERLYILNNISISDDIFLESKYPRDYKSMRTYLKTLGYELDSFDSQKKYREGLARFFGMDARKYAKILPKALAFRPIDLQNFVFEFLLDDEPIDIQSLKNNVEQLKRIELEIKKDREKLEKLEVIEEKGDLMLELTDQLAINEIIDQLNWIEKRESYIKKNQADLEKIDHKIENLRKDKTSLDMQVEEKDATILDLERSKGNSDLSKTIESYKEALQKKSVELSNQQQSIKVLKELLLKEFNTIKQLNDLIQSQTLKQFVIYYQENSESLDVLELSNLLQMVAKEVQSYLQAYHLEAKKIEDDRTKASNLMLQAQQRLHNLRKHVKTYPIYVERLIQTLNDRLSEMYERKVSVRPLCELLEVNDEVWRNALEGYLNTQRFDIIVDPSYFDDALEIYESVKSELRIYGVGLVNTQKLKAYDKVVENTLASKVDTDDPYARYYVNMLLNTIYTVDNVHELKNYSRAITPTCMTYINHTARQINPRVYEVPYIGQRATELQIQLETTEITNYDLEMEKLYEMSSKVNRIEKLLEQSSSMQIVYQNQVRLFDDVRQTRRDYVLLEEQLEELMKNPSIAKLEAQIEREKNLRRQLRAEQETVISNIAVERDNKNRILEAIDNAKEKIEEYVLKQKELNSKYPEKLALANTQYHALKSKHKEDHDSITNYLARSNASSNNQKVKLESEIISLMRTYIVQFHFSAAPQIEYLINFQQEANAIRNNNLIRYEQEAIELRRNSEISFKEEFVNKLRSSIESAQQQIAELNVALKDKYFGTDTYQLVTKASDNPEFKVYYDMIMSNDFVANQDLFTENLTKRNEAILMELFEKIASSDPEYEKLSFQFLDYRNYMSYDIEVINQNGNKLYFSKVSREKSGGETQVPFYIVIAASFQQLLTRNKRVNSGCIVLFDEAFNNMDESRIDAMMDFYSSLSIQLLIAVPPQRVSNIINYVQTSLIVVKDDDYAIVESFKDQRTLV